MSLYDDIEDTDDFGGWSLGATAKASPKPSPTVSKDAIHSKSVQESSKSNPTPPLVTKERSQMAALVSQAAIKRAAAETAAKQHRSSAGAVPDIRKVADASEQPIRFNALTGRLERGSATAATNPAFQGDFSVSFTGCQDEYEPSNPNDYEEVIRKRERERVAQRAAESQRRQARNNSRGSNSDGSNSDDDIDRRANRAPVKGAAIAPPKILLEDDSVPKVSTEPIPVTDQSKPTLGAMLGLSNNPASSSAGPSSIASRIMAKMGYKAGQGLGKLEQGMSRALQVEKTSLRGGRIIHEKDAPEEEEDTVTMPPPPQPGAPPAQTQQTEPTSTAESLKCPSKVICLRNMVGAGEVDDQLEGEVTEECQKYGKVAKCLVFEMPGSRDDEAVRIFLEFERQESAIKALIDLNGRFFGGRNVRANFYSIEKLRSFDLAGPI